eukprot:299968_1
MLDNLLPTPQKNGPKSTMESFEIRQSSMGIAKTSEVCEEEQDAPLLSIDYVHDHSLSNKSYGGTNQTNKEGHLKPTKRKSTFIDQKQASIPSSVFNLCNTIIGAGILSLPQAVSETGYGISAFLFIGIAAINLFTLNLNLTCAKVLAPNSSYTTLCAATIPQLKYIVDASVAITCFGVCIAYFVVIGDLLPDVITQYVDSDNTDDTIFMKALKERETWIIIYLICFIFPTIRLRKMDSLRFTSFFALLCFAYITIIVVSYATVHKLEPCRSEESENDKCLGNREVWPSGQFGILRVFKAIPIFMFSYTCHFNTFSICNELENNTMKRINKTIFYTICLVFVIYCTVGYFGYYTYGDFVASNILTKYPQEEAILIVRIGLSFAIAFSYPVLLHPCRNCLGSMFFNEPNCEYLSPFRFWLLTGLIVVFSFAIAMVADDLGDILGIIGATGISVIAFILPGLFYYYMKGVEEIDKEYYKWKRNCGLVFVVIGTVLIPFCIVMQFVTID